MGLKGSKSILSLRSLPSSVRTVPVYTTKPFGGTCTQGLLRIKHQRPSCFKHSKTNLIKRSLPYYTV